MVTWGGHAVVSKLRHYRACNRSDAVRESGRPAREITKENSRKMTIRNGSATPMRGKSLTCRNALSKSRRSLTDKGVGDRDKEEVIIDGKSETAIGVAAIA